MNSTEVSVIIPAYNAAATISQTLEAITRQDIGGFYEVIVVDDGSSDGTAACVHKFANVRYVHQDNAGPAAARNHGARLAQGKVLAFTDSDCVAHPDWLSNLMRGLNKEDIAVVCGSYGIANSQSLLARGIHTEIMFRHRCLMPDFPKAFGSYNFCVRKNVFWQVGGFNEAYRRASGEDNDLSYKILEAGYRIYFERKALVNHHHPTDLLRYMKEQFRHGLWRVKMYADHPQMMAGDNYTYWKDILEIPWAGLILLGIALSALQAAGFGAVAVFLIIPFLLLEIISALMMGCSLFESIFLGFVFFVRAFSRMIGFSTGILHFLFQKVGKKNK